MLPLRAIVPVRLHRPAEMRCCRLAARARALHRKHVSTLDMTERALMCGALPSKQRLRQ